MGANGSYGGTGSSGNTAHTHPIDEIENLRTQLGLKSPLVHTHELSSLRNIPTPETGKVLQFKEDGTGYEWVDASTNTAQYTIPEKPTLSVSLINNIVTLAITLGGNGGLDISSIKIRRMSTGQFAELFTTTPDMLTVTDDTAIANTTYSYEVIAVNPIGDSIPSDIISITTSTIPNDWFNDSWNRRIALTINDSQIPTTQTNYPMLINSIFPSLIGKSPNEFRFALEDRTELDYEIQLFNNVTGRLISWVKIPSIEDRLKLLMYYGNASAIDNQNINSVWDSDYDLVAHMSQTQGDILDSTINANHLTGMNSPSMGAVGKIGNAISFDGVDNYLTRDTPTLPIDDSPYTIEAWLMLTGTGGHGIAGWGNYGSAKQVNAFRTDGNTALVNYWWGSDFRKTVPNLSNSFHHVAVTYDGSQREIYVDAILQGVKVDGSLAVPNTDNFRIGSTNSGEYMNGILDEVRVSSVARSSDRLLTQVRNQNDPELFYSIGAVESI